jgi:hypothetical protein
MDVRQFPYGTEKKGALSGIYIEAMRYGMDIAFIDNLRFFQFGCIVSTRSRSMSPDYGAATNYLPNRKKDRRWQQKNIIPLLLCLPLLEKAL